MLKVTKPSTHRVDIELSGALSSAAMREGLDKLLGYSEGVTNGTMLYRIVDFQLPDLGALLVEFQQMPRLIGLLGKFRKCAVLCDTPWIRTAAEIEGAVIPGLEIKSFPLAQTREAEAWLSGSTNVDNDAEAENFPL